MFPVVFLGYGSSCKTFCRLVPYNRKCVVALAILVTPLPGRILAGLECSCIHPQGTLRTHRNMGRPVGEGLRSYYQAKIEELEIQARDKQHNLRRLEAQRNDLNGKGKLVSRLRSATSTAVPGQSLP